MRNTLLIGTLLLGINVFEAKAMPRPAHIPATTHEEVETIYDSEGGFSKIVTESFFDRRTLKEHYDDIQNSINERVEGPVRNAEIEDWQDRVEFLSHRINEILAILRKSEGKDEILDSLYLGLLENYVKKMEKELITFDHYSEYFQYFRTEHTPEIGKQEL